MSRPYEPAVSVAPPSGSLREVSGKALISPEVDGGLRVEIRHDDPPGALTQVERTQAMPGNLRWARRRGASMLLADIESNARARVEADNLASALARAPESTLAASWAELGAIDANQMRAVLRRHGLQDSALVARGSGLELRLPTAGMVRPVLVQSVASDWWLQCVVSTTDAVSQPTCADQALRFNASVRFARLAMASGTVLAEARVQRDSSSPEFLIRSARAVAALAQHATFALTTLHEIPEARAEYARLIALFTTSKTKGEGS